MSFQRYSPNCREGTYYRNRYNVFVPFYGTGILAIEKPQIQKRFWFGENDCGYNDDGPGSMAFAIRQCEAVRQKDGFFAHNLEGLEWKGYDICRPLYLAPAYVNHPECGCLAIIGGKTAARYHDSDPSMPLRIMEKFEHEYMSAAYRKVRADMEKRLNTYWNRYGSKHIVAHTYWTEC